MRRNMMVVVGLAAAVSGCSVFSAHSDVVQEAAGQKLTAERLADILTRIRAPMQYDTKTGTFVTALWTDVTLFSQAVAANKMTGDSAFIAEAMWPTIVEATYTRWIDTVLAKRANISQTRIDSAWNADGNRAIQHILVKVDSGAAKQVKEIAHKKIEMLLGKVKSGESFSKVAYENTEDEGSKADSGYYGPKPKGQYVGAFEKMLWQLKPGEMTGIVTTEYGYHIMRRPTQQESARLWRDSLARASAEPVIVAYYDELGKTNDMKVDASAIPHMRAALEDRPAHISDKTVLSSYKGGQFTTADFVRWIGAALADPVRGPDQEAGLKQAPDSDYAKMVKLMTQQQLVLAEAKAAHVSITAAEWKGMMAQFNSIIDALKADIGLVGPTFDGKSTSERSKIAATKVEEYFNDLVTQKKQLKSLPGQLSVTLHQREKVKFSPVALQHGLDLAKAKHSADSAKAAASGEPVPNTKQLPSPEITPAPSGPPVNPPAPKKP